MPGTDNKARFQVDSRAFRKAITGLARQNGITNQQQLNRTLYFASLRTYKKTKRASKGQIQSYFGQTGSQIGRVSKAGTYTRFKRARGVFGRRSIAQLMALKILRAGGKRITKAGLQSLATRIVNKALKGVGYFQAGWVNIGKRAARRAGPGVFPFGLGKVPFIRAKTFFNPATGKKIVASLTYQVRARKKGTKDKRTFILPEMEAVHKSELNAAANEEILKYNQRMRRDVRRAGFRQ